jgi:hypothetical protein
MEICSFYLTIASVTNQNSNIALLYLNNVNQEFFQQSDISIFCLDYGQKGGYINNIDVKTPTLVSSYFRLRYIDKIEHQHVMDIISF